MKTRWLILTAALGAAALSGLAADAADWPQWRGPERNGISEETGLLKQWPEGGPKLLWQVKDLGGGYSTPSVVGDRLYLITNKGLEEESVLALAVKDGKRVWSTRLGKVGEPDQRPPYPGARSTPTVDGDLIYALGSDGDLACLEAATGKVRWAKNVRTEFGGKPGEWAYSESPLVDGDKVVVTPGGAEAAVVALDKASGEVIWKCAVPEGDEAAYSSAVVAEVGGVRQYVQFLGKGVVGVDAKTGKLLWRYAKTAEGSPANIPTPLVIDEFVYSATGRGGGGLVKIETAGGAVEAEEVYASPRLPTSIGGAVAVDGHLYGTNRQGLLCAEIETGDVKWQDRSVGAGSLLYADGRLYVHGEEGDVALVEANPESYREHGRFTPPGQPDRGESKAWAYPVVANGRLYLHDFGTLWCYDVKAK
ncbi:MAG TPA: PQQ-binding-like beta-propeller repeat protein [Planctomycetaceae bacterium]